MHFLTQQPSKAESDRVNRDFEGLPSLEARKSLLSSQKPAAEVRKDPVIVAGASIQERLTGLNKEEEVKKTSVEPMTESLAERKARIQQALMAKMGPGGQGVPAAIPIITAGIPTFTSSTPSTAASVAPSEVDKPTIQHTIMRRVADFDDFD